MITSSAFVMAALTMTGIFMRENTTQDSQDGYTIDFEALESQTNKLDELARAEQNQTDTTENKSVATPVPREESVTQQDTEPQTEGEELKEQEAAVPDSDLDYLSEEEEIALMEENLGGDIAEEADTDPGESVLEEAIAEPEVEQVEATSVQNLNFTAEQGLTAPVESEILMHYSMDSTTYFATLAQYKYNPAVIFTAAEGMPVYACAEGQVVDIFENEEIGQAVTLDLGGGYRATYGQLADLTVSVGDYVSEGETIASVAAPTIYYTVEGTNLYFSLTQDGTSVNPETYFK